MHGSGRWKLGYQLELIAEPQQDKPSKSIWFVTDLSKISAEISKLEPKATICKVNPQPDQFQVFLVPKKDRTRRVYDGRTWNASPRKS